MHGICSDAFILDQRLDAARRHLERQRDDAMTAFFATGRVIDVVLALVACEWVALFIYHRRTGRGVAPGSISLNLASGVFLMLAVRSALVGSAWGWVAAFLVGALCAHAADLATRWRR